MNSLGLLRYGGFHRCSGGFHCVRGVSELRVCLGVVVFRRNCRQWVKI